MLVDMCEALRNGIKVLENSEAVLLYMEYGYVDRAGFRVMQEVKPGEYLAICKESGYSVWLGAFSTHKSTKGDFQRCKKAFERYSPNEMAKLWREAGVIQE